MADDKPKYHIIQGNIADYQGGAIVVPSWTNMSTSNAISHAITTRLRQLRANIEKFWPEPTDIRDSSERLPLYSAHLFESPQLPGVDACILATCYVDEGEQDAPFSEKAARTTANALKVASEKGINSIAFPTLMTGYGGGSLDEIIPSMISEFNSHLRNGQSPSDIALYVFGNEAYQKTLKLAQQVK